MSCRHAGAASINSTIQPLYLGITVEELARRYREAKSIRVLAGSLGVSYSALQRRLQAEGIIRQAALTEEVRQRKRRRARDAVSSAARPE